jgi:hypothetical protein
MTRSEPNIFRMTLMALYLFLTATLFCLLILEWLTGVMEMNILAKTFLTISVITAGLLFIVFELPIVLMLTIDDHKMIVKNLLTRKSKEFLFENIHSFKISIQIRIHSGPQADLILLRHGEAIESISLTYIHNLDQIIKGLEKQLRNVTDDEYGFLRYLRERQNN